MSATGRDLEVLQTLVQPPTSCLAKGELTQVLENLRQQDAGATLDLRRRAIAHYLQYDALLVLAADHRAESQ